MQRLRRSSRGQATAIGAILFFAIVIIMLAFMYEVYNVQAAMNQFDTGRIQERYEISDVLFGDLKTYTHNYSTVISGQVTQTIVTGSGTNPFYPSSISSALVSGSKFPAPNMNFTASADHWSFTRSFYGTGSGSSGASGAYTTDPTGSPSGGGAVYADFRYNPPSGKYAGAYMNWTTRFYVDLTDFGGPAAITSVKLSWGRRVTLFDTVSGPSAGSKCPIRLYLIDPNNFESQLDSVVVGGVDINWFQRSNVIVPTSSIPSNGWYKIVIVSQVELGHSGTGPPKFQAYFDDVGITIYADTHVIDWFDTFTISEAPALVEQLDALYAGRFNVSRTQHLYIMDASNNKWVLLSRSLVSTSSRTFTHTFSETDVQRYISITGQIKVRSYTVGTSPFTCIADATSIRNYFTGTTSKITLSFRNTGGVSVHLVSLWIIDSIGHYRFDLDINLSPGETMQYTVAHAWSYGVYTFKAVTDRGTIIMYSTTA